MATSTYTRPERRVFIFSLFAATLAISVHGQDSRRRRLEGRQRGVETEEIIDYGNHNLEWEDGPASWEEFGHDNDPSVCGLPVLTVEEWEEGRYWEGNKPVLVKNVTDGWAALKNWRLQEMLRLYPDAEATMGDGRKVGESGPDAAGNLLSPTTVKVREQYMNMAFF